MKWLSRLLAFLLLPICLASEDLSFLDEAQNLGSSYVQEVNGVVMLQDIEHVSDLLHDSQSSLVLVALHSPACPHSIDMVQKLEEVTEILSTYFESLLQKSPSTESENDPAPPLVARLDSNHVDREWVQTLGIDYYPSLFFFRQVKDETVVMEYVGLTLEPSSIAETMLHNWYRYEWGPLVTLPSLHDVQAFIRRHGPGILRHVPPPRNPEYTEEEKATISWLMESEDDEPDPYVILVQCQGNQEEAAPIQRNFTNLAKAASTQRDVFLFCAVDCEGQGGYGDILSFRVNARTLYLGESQRMPAGMRLDHFSVLHMTPSVLFYDRVSTGPIAFGSYRKVHAVLCVRLNDEDHQSYNAIRSFRKACQARRLAGDNSMVCFVVPESETRILTSFGVDVWTSLDAKVTDGTKVPDVMPVLLITDQRTQHFRRHYLGASDIIKDALSIPKFIQDFWDSKLMPETKSSSMPARVNKHGVEIINGNSFKEVVTHRHKHSLLYIHAPTCGHCKRFSIVWNDLAKTVKSVAWDDFIDVLKMDVTENEIEGVNPAFLPAVYYFPLGAKRNPVQFTVRDKFGDSVGRLQDPIEVLDWMLSVGQFDEANLFEVIGDSSQGDLKEESDRSKVKQKKPEEAKLLP